MINKHHKYGRLGRLATLAVLPAFVLAGCSGESGTSQIATGGGALPEVEAQTGSIQIAAKFPQHYHDEVGAALIDPNVNWISVCVEEPVWPAPPAGEVQCLRSARLDYNNWSATITNVPVGPARIRISAYDAENMGLDYVHVGMDIQEGTNQVKATLIRGRWTFQDPIVLDKTSPGETNPATLDSFSVIPFLWQAPTVSSASAPEFDLGKAIGINRYRALFRGSMLPDVRTECEYHYYDEDDYWRDCWLEADSFSAESLGGYLAYANQVANHVAMNSLSTIGSPSGFDDDYIPLPPRHQDGQQFDRWAIMVSHAAWAWEGMWRQHYGWGSDDDDHFHDEMHEDLMSRLNTRVTAADEIQGVIAEMVMWSEDEYCEDMAGDRTACPWDDDFVWEYCVDSEGVVVPCPSYEDWDDVESSAVTAAASAGARVAGPRSRSERMSALLRQLQQNDRVGAASTFDEASGCYRGYAFVDRWQGWPQYRTEIELDEYGYEVDWRQVRFDFVEVFEEDLDICLHTFTATGEPLPTADLNVIIE